MLGSGLAQPGQLVVATDEARELRRQVRRQGVEPTQRREVVDQTVRDELMHPLGTRQVAKPVVAEVLQQAVRVAEHRRGRARHEDLSAVPDRHEPRRAVQCGTEIVTVTLDGLSRVDAHTDPQEDPARPAFGLQRSLPVHRGADRIGGATERRRECIAGGREHVPAVRLDRLTEQLVVHTEGGAHRVRLFLPQPRRTLEIGEQEGHGPRRRLRHDPNVTTPH